MMSLADSVFVFGMHHAGRRIRATHLLPSQSDYLVAHACLVSLPRFPLTPGGGQEEHPSLPAPSGSGVRWHLGAGAGERGWAQPGRHSLCVRKGCGERGGSCHVTSLLP